MHLFLIFIENTIKHAKIDQPTIKIDYQDHEDIIKFNLHDKGIGISKI